MSVLSSFEISGEFVTDYARDLFLSENYHQAEEFLVDAISGMTLEAARDILLGSLRLTGNSRDNNLALEPEEKETALSWKEELEEFFKFHFLDENGHCRLITNLIIGIDGRDMLEKNQGWMNQSIFRQIPPSPRGIKPNHSGTGGTVPYVQTIYRQIINNYNLFVSPKQLVALNYLEPARLTYARTCRKLLSMGEIIHCDTELAKVNRKRSSPKHLDPEAIWLYISRPAKQPPSWIKITSDIRDFRKIADELPSAGVRQEDLVQDQLTPEQIHELEVIKVKTQEVIKKVSTFQEVGSEDNADKESQQEELHKKLRADILEQAKESGMMDIKDKNGAILASVPLAPFHHWALRNHFGLRHKAPAWKSVSPDGLKMFNDDPNHTDWMIGGDIDIDDWMDKMKDNPLRDAAWDLRFDIEREYTKFSFAVLLKGHTPEVSGKLVFPGPNEQVNPGEIAVIPNLGPDYFDAGRTAAALISKTGGQMAHLVTVLRETPLPIIRPDDTYWGKLSKGTKVSFNTDTGIFNFVRNNLYL